jgi:hypothetical protein
MLFPKSEVLNYQQNIVSCVGGNRIGDADPNDRTPCQRPTTELTQFRR